MPDNNRAIYFVSFPVSNNANGYETHLLDIAQQSGQRHYAAQVPIVSLNWLSDGDTILAQTSDRNIYTE